MMTALRKQACPATEQEAKPTGEAGDALPEPEPPLAARLRAAGLAVAHPAKPTDSTATERYDALARAKGRLGLAEALLEDRAGD